MDEKIAKALLKNPLKQNKIEALTVAVTPEKKGRITVAHQDLRTYKDGTVFASAGELARWDHLLYVQREGEIRNLKRQVPFVLQESFIHKQWGDVSHLLYVADFTYTNISFRRGIGEREIVEDSKGGHLTDIYKIKRKLFLYKYAGYLFYEV